MHILSLAMSSSAQRRVWPPAELQYHTKRDSSLRRKSPSSSKDQTQPAQTHLTPPPFFSPISFLLLYFV